MDERPDARAGKHRARYALHVAAWCGRRTKRLPPLEQPSSRWDGVARRGGCSCRRRPQPTTSRSLSRLTSAARVLCLIKMGRQISRNQARSTPARTPMPMPMRGDNTRRVRAATRRSAKAPQLELPFRAGWGGARPGAGRPRRGSRPCTPHRARPPHAAAHPVHVTLRAGLGPLRSRFLFPTLRLAIARATRVAPARFRVAHFSVQADHVHLIVEAADKRALSAGVQSVAIRIARYVNDLLRRRGRFWADRWHRRALKSPREVRNALVYVLGNFRKHARRPLPPGLDPFSSAEWFDGFRWSSGELGFVGRAPPCQDSSKPVSRAETWLLARGWRKRGLLGLAEAPKG